MMSSSKKDYLKLNPYLEITSGINAVLTFSEGVIKVIGSKGSGKTSVCHLLLDELKEEDLETLFFPEAPESPQALEEYIQQKLSLNRQSDFVTALIKHIVGKPTHLQKLVLVFDDAETINDDAFQTIIELSELKDNVTLLVNIVFCGNEELDKKLNEADKQSILEKVILSLQISPMTRNELEDFCRAYMAKVGLAHHILSDEDHSRILEISNGYPEKVPEVIYELLDREVTEKVSEEGGKDSDKGLMGKLVELDDDPEPDLVGLSVSDREQVLMEFQDKVPWRWQSNGVAIAVVLLFVVVAYGWFVPSPPPSEPPAIIFNEAEPVVEQVQQIAQEAEPVIPEPELVQPEQVIEPEAIPEELAELEQALITEEVAEVEAVVTVEEETQASPEEIAEAPSEQLANQTPAADTALETAEVLTNTEETGQLASVASEPSPAVTVATPTTIATPAIIDTQATPTTRATPATTASRATVSRAVVSSVPAGPELVEPQRVLNDWAEAWESQDLTEYFEHYQDRFEPTYHNSQSMWRGDRQTKISRPKFIEIDVEGLELVNSSVAGLTVRFWLSYVSSYYKDRTLKEVLLTENNLGELLIMQERNLEVEIIPYYP